MKKEYVFTNSSDTHATLTVIIPDGADSMRVLYEAGESDVYLPVVEEEYDDTFFRHFNCHADDLLNPEAILKTVIDGCFGNCPRFQDTKDDWSLDESVSTPSTKEGFLKMAQAKMEEAQELLKEGGFKLVFDTCGDATAVHAIPEEVDFEDYGDGEEAGQFIASAPEVLPLGTVYADGCPQATCIPDWFKPMQAKI
jgi:hypothetical protein